MSEQKHPCYNGSHYVGFVYAYKSFIKFLLYYFLYILIHILKACLTERSPKCSV